MLLTEFDPTAGWLALITWLKMEEIGIQIDAEAFQEMPTNLLPNTDSVMIQVSNSA